MNRGELKALAEANISKALELLRAEYFGAPPGYIEAKGAMGHMGRAIEWLRMIDAEQSAAAKND